MASKSIILPIPRNKSKISKPARDVIELNARICEIAIDLAGSAKGGRQLFAAWVSREKHPLLRKLDNRVKALKAESAKESFKRRTENTKSTKRKETEMTPKKMPKRLRDLADFLDRSEHFSYTPRELGPIANELRAAASLMASLMARTPTVEKRGYLRRSARTN